MPLDGCVLNFIAAEIGSKIIGSRIEKIHQPTRDRLVFYLRTREKAYKLLVSASPDSPRIHLTELSSENPAVPPMLCMLFRKHLTGGIITSVYQLGLDRAVYIDISATNEIGDKVQFTLCAEIMAKHSNIVLVNSEGIIIDAVKRVDETQSSVRQIIPGFRYIEPPRQGKSNIKEADISSVIDRIRSERSKTLSGAVLSTLEGVSPLISREISSRVSSSDVLVEELTEVHYKKLCKELQGLKTSLLEGRFVPTVLYKEENRPFDFTFTDVIQYGFAVTAKKYDTFSQLLDDYYYEKDRLERTKQQSQSLLKILSSAYSRAERKFLSRTEELKECDGKETLRVNAELIFANQYSLEKGALYYDLENFYDEYKPTRIKADPALSPSGNAQKYYKEYNKLKNAEKLLGSLIEESKNEVEYLESVIDAVKRADGFSEISEIKAELYDQGYLKRNKEGKKGNNKKNKALPAIEYVSDDGYTILVGRNNVQNEALSFKTAAKDDSWFHVQKMPGSHVVVIGNGDIIPERTCRQAAILAAWHSGARDSSQVPVDYTIVKELKKPQNGKPGKVIYHTYNTMWVNPDRELEKRLRRG